MPLDKGGMGRYNSIAFRSGCSAAGSALGSGPRGRGFKSRHSDQKSRMRRRSGFFFSRLSPTALRRSFPSGRERSRTDAFGANHAAAVFPGAAVFRWQTRALWHPFPRVLFLCGAVFFRFIPLKF